jgi:hypothetical protein
MTDDRIIGMRKTFLARHICVLKGVPDEEIIDWCERDEPCGTSHGWGIDYSQGRVQCADDQNREHVVVTA